MRLVQLAYNRAARPHLPRKLGVAAGVVVRYPRLFDATDRFPDYKRGMVEAITNSVREGDVVTEIGTGRGVLTVRCLRTGAERVDGYDASPEMIERARETLALEAARGGPGAAHVTLSTAVVGQAIDVPSGLSDEVSVIHPAELPVGDVLLLDVEGAERVILTHLTTRPRVIIVETHPPEAPADVIRDMLHQLDYDVIDREYQPDIDTEGKAVLEATL